MGFIYTLTSPSGKLYNGQTNRDIHERFDEHQKPNSGKRKTAYKFRWSYEKKDCL